MSSTKRALAVLVGPCLALAAFVLIWSRKDSRSSRLPEDVDPASRMASVVVGVDAIDDQVTLDNLTPTSLSRGVVEPGDDTSRNLDVVSAQDSMGLWGNLKAAIESGALGRTEPLAVLNAAAEIIRTTEPSSGLPEFAEGGSMTVALEGTPPGLTAYVAINPSRKWDQMLTLNIAFDEPDEPTFLDGLLRNQAQCRVSVYGKGGEVGAITITTEFEPHYKKMLDRGMPFGVGTFIHGASWTAWPGDPSRPPKISLIGMREGKVTSWEDSIPVDGQSPSPSQLSEFGGAMLLLHSKMKEGKR